MCGLFPKLARKGKQVFDTYLVVCLIGSFHETNKQELLEGRQLLTVAALDLVPSLCFGQLDQDDSESISNRKRAEEQ